MQSIALSFGCQHHKGRDMLYNAVRMGTLQRGEERYGDGGKSRPQKSPARLARTCSTDSRWRSVTRVKQEAGEI